MSTHEQARCCRVRRYSLVMFPFSSKSMSESYPRWTKMRVHHACLAEISSRLRDLVNSKIVYAHCEPCGRLLGVIVRQVVRDEEQHIFRLQLVETCQMYWVDAEIVLVRFENCIGDFQRILVSALRVEEISSSQLKVGVL